MGAHAELHNSMSISIIEQAMIPQMKHEWVKLIASKECSSSEKFESLLTFLGDWRNRLEYVGARICDAPAKQLTDVGYTLHVDRAERGLAERLEQTTLQLAFCQERERSTAEQYMQVSARLAAVESRLENSKRTQMDAEGLAESLKMI